MSKYIASFFALSVLILTISCSKLDVNPLEKALMSNHPAIQKVMHNLVAHEVQILYTQIDKDSMGNTVFTEYSFQLDDEQYFYPASTVKLPAAVLALEWIQTLDSITTQVPYGFKGDTSLYDLKTDLRLIFGISDNAAYNRLYELLGRDSINSKLRSKNITPVRISHRLSTPNANRAHREPFFFWYSGDTIAFNGGKDSAIEPLELKGLHKGTGFLQNDSLIESPMDFSEKNYFPLRSQQELLKRLFYPEKYAQNQQFKLNESRHGLLSRYISDVPYSLGFRDTTYYDAYGKFLIFGDSKDSIPHHVKIHNKVGYAYGTLTDNAYVVDEAYDIKFFLSATILVNENGIFNDNEYEYEEIGIPFLAQLGREIYLYERQRKK
ncbi:MAG: hypothetical protein HKN48_12590 [Flavobacteriaceae bacterium]|nr:hypothetical protein [Flavobacteriaceae bacterium]